MKGNILGTGSGHSVKEVIAMVEQVSGRPVDARNAPRRPGDPAELVAATGRAGELLGWQPQHSDLKNIIATALRWQEQHVPQEPAADDQQATGR